MAKSTSKKSTKLSPLLNAGLTYIEKLLAIPSASNRVEAVADYVVQVAKKFGYTVARDPDDTLRITIKGKDTRRVVAYGAHLDRIGLMVHDLCDDGTVRMSGIGGLYPGHVMDGVVASVVTNKGQTYAGVITHVDTPIHKVGREGFQKREHKREKLRLRLDACIGCTKKDGKAKLKELGVQVGQLIWLDPMLVIERTHGTLRSRWLDNTLGCAALLALLEEWSKAKFVPACTTDLLWSAAEEAGMGGTSVMRPEMTDFISVDTSIGEETEDLANCVIKQKAGAFPFTASLTKELEQAAEAADAGFERRVFEGGGTDAEQARSAGFKGRLGCIVVPIYGLHSIEAATFKGFENLMRTLDSHAKGHGTRKGK